MDYILNREALRVVEKNDRGSVTYRRRYKKGDRVDVSHMDEAHVENLVGSGALVGSEDDLSEAESATGTAPTSPPFGASTTGPEDTPEAESEDEGDGGDVESNTFDAERESGEDVTPEDDEDGEDVDRYAEMDYASLQQEAKTRTGNGSGSADDLRARLRAADASA